MRITVPIPAELLGRIDREARRLKFTINQLIIDSLKEELAAGGRQMGATSFSKRVRRSGLRKKPIIKR